jgi:16S rRNA (guanine527-N7)-methyltransferase
MPSNLAPLAANIQKALHEFQLEASAEQIEQIREYINLLLTWNEKLNLTAIRDPLDILYRHFCESMFGTKAVDLSSCRVADIGTGGGFPGLPLKIMVPSLDLVLVESNIKKATFLAEVVRALNLDGVNVSVSRYEELGEEVAPLDYVCARAVGELPPLLKWARSESVGSNRVMLWLGAKDAEDVSKIDGWVWDAPVAVPQSLRRVIAVGTKVV